MERRDELVQQLVEKLSLKPAHSGGATCGYLLEFRKLNGPEDRSTASLASRLREAPLHVPKQKRMQNALGVLHAFREFVCMRLFDLLLH
jgi:hypothetical protein